MLFKIYSKKFLIFLLFAFSPIYFVFSSNNLSTSSVQDIQQDVSDDKTQSQLKLRLSQFNLVKYPTIKCYADVEDVDEHPYTNADDLVWNAEIDGRKAKIKVKPFFDSNIKTDYTVLYFNPEIIGCTLLDWDVQTLLKFIYNMREKDTISYYIMGDKAVTFFKNYTKKRYLDMWQCPLEHPDFYNFTNNNPRLYDSIVDVINKVKKQKADRKV